MRNYKNEIVKLRHQLHKIPELSNQEYKTTQKITSFFEAMEPDKIILQGNTSKIFVFNGKNPGKTIVFRAELDALPVREINTIEYISENSGFSHACGHDGHMSILAGLAKKIRENPIEFGTIAFLFQAAEENEQGAKDVVYSVEFQELEPDYIFALHNIPGTEKNSVLLKEGSFAAASKGMTVKLYGKTSHAAEPENGINPADALAKIITELHILRKQSEYFSDLILLTIIHIQLGEIAFGTSPGYAEIRVTLRAFENDDMDLLTIKIEEIIHAISLTENLKYDISYSEIFPATVNHTECVQYIRNAATKNSCKINLIEKPFKWSEDFAYYAQKYKCGFFGLGAGRNQPALHNPDYDFPDDIIETGVNLFYDIFSQING